MIPDGVGPQRFATVGPPISRARAGGERSCGQWPTVCSSSLRCPRSTHLTVDTADITNAVRVAVRYESPGATGIVFASITSTGSGAGTGFYSSQGSNPAGVTFVDNFFR